MDVTTGYSERGILEMIAQIDRDNFILANAVRMMYYAALRKNEITDIKIKDILREGVLVSEIQPFLEKSTRMYTSKPISLEKNKEAKQILADHIKRLKENGYDLSGDAPLFPNPHTKKNYTDRMLGKHLARYGITPEKVRASGIRRYEAKLAQSNLSSSQRKERLREFSRHSRPDTPKRLITGTVQKAGKQKKGDLPWEFIVRSIEGLARKRSKKERLKEVRDIGVKITEVKDNNVKDSLNRLLRSVSKTVFPVTAKTRDNKGMSELLGQLDEHCSHRTMTQNILGEEAMNSCKAKKSEKT